LGLHLAVGGLVYTALFVGVAVRGEERRFYWTKLRSLVVREPEKKKAA
jgi:hypothetical protein